MKKELTEIEIKTIITFSMSHSLRDTAKEFTIGVNRLRKLLEDNKVERPLSAQITKQTKLRKYGNENYNNTEKNHQTKLIRYGDSHYNNSKPKNLDKSKIKKSYYIKKGRYDEHGVYKNGAQKTKETCLYKYGSLSASGSPEIRAKIEQTNLERYGCKNPFQNEQVKQKIRKVQTKRYGGIGYASEELKNKSSKTTEELYGVKYFCLHQKCIDALFSAHDNSKPNKQFEELLKKLNLDYISEFTIDTYRYDFKVDNLLFEINPTATHNCDWSPFGKDHKGIDKKYHELKRQVAEAAGYRCIHIWEWDNLDTIITTFLVPKIKVFARNCYIKEVDNLSSRLFLDTYHLQGYCPATFQYGLYTKDSDELVAIMTFGKPRYNKSVDYELLRYCTKAHVIGGSKKLFKHFIEQRGSCKIISYCDLSKFTGIMYEKLGFEKIRTTIGIHWSDGKRHITDNLLRQQGFDRLLGNEFGVFGKGTSNEELMLKFGFYRIYDAGQATYLYKK